MDLMIIRVVCPVGNRWQALDSCQAQPHPRSSSGSRSYRGPRGSNERLERFVELGFSAFNVMVGDQTPRSRRERLATVVIPALRSA
jgi:hypothetical protein